MGTKGVKLAAVLPGQFFIAVPYGVADVHAL